MTAARTIRILSATPGRVRFHVPALEGDLGTANVVAARLAAAADVDAVTVNSRTGGVLVLFSDLSTERVRELLRDALPWRTIDDVPHAAGERANALPLGTLAGGALAAGLALVRPLVTAIGTAVGLSRQTADRMRGRTATAVAADDSPRGAGTLTNAYEHPIRALMRYRPEYRVQVRKAVVTTVANKMLDLAPPFLIAVAIDLVSGGTALGILGTAPMVGLVILTAATILIWGLESWTEYRFKTQWEGFAHRLQKDVRLDAYSRIQVAEMAYLEGTTTGEVMKVVNSDVNTIENFFRDGLDHMVGVGVNLVIAAIAFVLTAPLLSLATLIPIPLILWYSRRFEKRLGGKLDVVREHAGTINSVLVNDITGMTTIRSFTAEELELRRLSGLSEQYLQSADIATHATASFTPIVRMAVLTGFAATLILGGYMVTAGTLTPALFAFMLLLTQRILWPLTGLGHAIDNYERTVVAARRIFRLLEAPVGPISGNVPLVLEDVEGSVTFSDVVFGYDPEQPVLNGFSMHFPPGQTTAIVGVTGSGKSTVVKLLLYFYDATSGSILVDGVDIRRLRTRDLRQAIGLVSQDVFLFDGTIYDNIAYGRPGATDEEVENAARAAEAHAFIDKLPAGYRTVVGERGVKLSGGQRQRVSLARAFLKNPPILVLDEATSSVDNETEAAIQKSLQELAKGRTTIAIAHRLSTVRYADQIYVLGEHGRIVESGTHDELVRLGGYYARLWNIQTGRALIEAENGDDELPTP